MYSKILDNETMSRVIAAAPVVVGPSAVTAGQVLSVLQKETHKPRLARTRVIPGNCMYYFMRIKEIAEEIGGGVSEAMIGRILGQMGLEKFRRGEGYYVAWNEKQLEIISQALA